MSGSGWNMGMNGSGLMIMLLLVLLVAGVIAVLALVRNQGTHVRHIGSLAEADRSLQIVRERFAKGELTREQFEVLKRDLGN